MIPHRLRDFGSGIQPQITRPPPQRPHMKNDGRREHMSSTAPQKKKKYFSTTNHHGGAIHSSYYQLPRAHFGHPYTLQRHYQSPRGAPPLFAHLLILTYQSPRGRSKYSSLDTLSSSSLHTTYQSPRGRSKYPSLDTPHPPPYIPSYYQAPRGRHKYTLFPHPSSTTNLHRRTLFLSLDTPHPYTLPISTDYPSYGRYTAYRLSRSLSRVQAGVAEP